MNSVAIDKISIEIRTEMRREVVVQCRGALLLFVLEYTCFKMNLTIATLAERIAALELQIGIGCFQPHGLSEKQDEPSLVYKLATLEAEVDRVFIENSDLRGLPDIIKAYRDDPKLDIGYSMGLDKESQDAKNSGLKDISLGKSDSGKSHTLGNICGDLSALGPREVLNAEMQELVLINYPSLMECYNLLVEFLTIHVPMISSELSDQLSLEGVADKRTSCEEIASLLQLLTVKSLVLFEEFAIMIRQQTSYSQNVDQRLKVLASKLSCLEREKASEKKY